MKPRAIVLTNLIDLPKPKSFKNGMGMRFMKMGLLDFNIAGTEFRTKRCNSRGVVVCSAEISEEKCFMFIRSQLASFLIVFRVSFHP